MTQQKYKEYIELLKETRNLVLTGAPGTGKTFMPLPMMTAYGADCSEYPNSYDYYRNLITLPLHTLLTDEDVAYVCESLREAVR